MSTKYFVDDEGYMYAFHYQHGTVEVEVTGESGDVFAVFCVLPSVAHSLQKPLTELQRVNP